MSSGGEGGYGVEHVEVDGGWSIVEITVNSDSVGISEVCGTDDSPPEPAANDNAETPGGAT